MSCIHLILHVARMNFNHIKNFICFLLIQKFPMCRVWLYNNIIFDFCVIILFYIYTYRLDNFHANKRACAHTH